MKQTSLLIDFILTSSWISFVISDWLFEMDISRPVVYLCKGDSEIL
jgi:hypothetical protein